jgi:hypothetical protein
MTITCPYCSKPAVFASGTEVYPHRGDLSDKQFWVCWKDLAWVGVHQNTTLPLGRLANARLRKAKTAAHVAFDPLWRPKPQNVRSDYRKRAYAWLAKAMGLSPAECHIGMFDEAQCARVVELCREKTAAALAAELMGET